jgi:hypothetical protein
MSNFYKRRIKKANKMSPVNKPTITKVQDTHSGAGSAANGDTLSLTQSNVSPFTLVPANTVHIPGNIHQSVLLSEKFTPALKDPINFFDSFLHGYIISIWENKNKDEKYTPIERLTRPFASYVRLLFDLVSDEQQVKQFKLQGEATLEISFETQRKRIDFHLKCNSQSVILQFFYYRPHAISEVIRAASGIRDIVDNFPLEGRTYLPDELVRRYNLANEWEAKGISYTHAFSF